MVYLKKIIGLVLMIFAIYLWVSFFSVDSLPNPFKDICEVFGRLKNSVCMYTGAINWLVISLTGGIGYGIFQYKPKPTQLHAV